MPTWFKTRGYVYNHSVSSEDDVVRRQSQEANNFPIYIDLEMVSTFQKTTKAFQYQNDFGDVGGTTLVSEGSEYLIETRFEDFEKIFRRFIGAPINDILAANGLQD